MLKIIILFAFLVSACFATEYIARLLGNSSWSWRGERVTIQNEGRVYKLITKDGRVIYLPTSRFVVEQVKL